MNSSHNNLDLKNFINVFLKYKFIIVILSSLLKKCWNDSSNIISPFRNPSETVKEMFSNARSIFPSLWPKVNSFWGCFCSFLPRGCWHWQTLGANFTLDASCSRTSIVPNDFPQLSRSAPPTTGKLLQMTCFYFKLASRK